MAKEENINEYEAARIAGGPSLLMDEALAARDAADPRIHEAMRVFEFLNGRNFTALEVCAAAGISDKTLSNWIGLHKLVLASPTPGRGRARQYCLFDAYVLAIMKEIVRITGSPASAAGIMWKIVFYDSFVSYLPEDERIDEVAMATKFNAYMDDVCRDVRTSSVPWAIDRHRSHSLLLIPREGDETFNPYVDSNPAWSLLANEESFAFVNLSKIIANTDQRLLDALVGDRPIPQSFSEKENDTT